MKNLFGDVKFKYEFRDYQQRVLDSIDKKLADNKLHIVAAPGSGKTILGLETIRRIGDKALILVPSINLREQWEQRFINGFVNEEDSEYWNSQMSNDLDTPKIITCVTYQALYQYLQRDTIDVLAKKLLEGGVKTVCLDEAHHLQKEWWKALELLISNMGDIKLISLTATPPYDSTELEWERYCKLCGDIDLEIYAPEMVQKHCICPYQDYVYLCVPDEKECEEINSIISLKNKRKVEILKSESLYRQIIKHPGLKNPDESIDLFSKYPEYVNALISYLQTYAYPLRFMYEENRKVAENVFKSISPKIRGLLHYDENDVMTDVDFYNLITGIITYDVENFDEEFIEKFKELLTHYVFLHNGKITRSGIEDKVSSILKKSGSRLEGIEAVVEHEKAYMQENTRCLVLADKIGKEDIALIGTDGVVKSIGCVSIFEKLRRREHLNNIGNYVSFKRFDEQRDEGVIQTGMLCASFAILPEHAVKSADLSGKPIKDTGYAMVNIDDRNRKSIVENVTRLFDKGIIKVLIGTAALLGEGWDAPCVNSVVIASVAATFVQSNQMRGRGLRINPAMPEKTANIYHLAVLLPELDCKENDSYQWNRALARYTAGEDYEKLCRRFDTFLGLDVFGNEIYSGIERLDIYREEYTLQQVLDCNKKTFERAKDRQTLYSQWQHFTANTKIDSIQYTVNISEKKEFVEKKGIAGLWERAVKGRTIGKDKKAAGSLAYILLKAMKQQSMMSKECSLSIINNKDKGIRVHLSDTSNKENTLFINALKELLSGIIDQKYIVRTKTINGTKYIPVPAVLCRRKEDAESFYRSLLKSSIYKNKRNTTLIYTRSDSGRSQLFEARLIEHAGRKKDIEVLKQIYRQEL